MEILTIYKCLVAHSFYFSRKFVRVKRCWTLIVSMLDFDNENVLAGGAILPERIVYADVRNRSFAA